MLCGLARSTKTDVYPSAERNGIMLMSHLHKCFDARILAIHPKTHHVRTFINYIAINPFHGRRAEVPRTLPPEVLQQHWDMCCLENTPSQWLSSPSNVLSNSPKLKSRVMEVIDEEPHKGQLDTRASGTQASGTPASGTQAPPNNLPPGYSTSALPAA